jgi:hypothetical protein
LFLFWTNKKEKKPAASVERANALILLDTALSSQIMAGHSPGHGRERPIVGGYLKPIRKWCLLNVQLMGAYHQRTHAEATVVQKVNQGTTSDERSEIERVFFILFLLPR